MREPERVEERAEQRPALGEVQPHQQALRERLAGIEHRREDARLRVGGERARGLRPQVARLHERGHGGAGELGRRLGEERGRGAQPLVRA